MKPNPIASIVPGLVLAFAFSAEAGEEEFAASLLGATLKGTWAPIQGKELGPEKADAYRVARAEKRGGDQWVIFWKINRGGQEIEAPIPCVVHFASDTAVLILDEVPVGDGKTWSARVLFHEDTYAGRWWGKDGEGGTVSGTISREP